MQYKMLHTCLRVMDLEKSLEFYEKAIGLKKQKVKDVPEHKFTLVFLTDEDENHALELTYNYDQDPPYVIGNGYSHIAVGVKDLEASRDFHKSLGYEVTDFKAFDGDIPRYYFVKDPDGYLVEVIRQA